MSFLKLIMLGSLMITGFCFGDDKDDCDDRQWARDLGNNSTSMVWHDLKEKFEDQEKLEGRFCPISREMIDGFGGENAAQTISSQNSSRLYIFVSSSMPMVLLQNYFREASKYSAKHNVALIFKGLPKGSFQELASLVTKIVDSKGGAEDKEDSEEKAGLLLDDEAFARFNIDSVPAIILAKEDEYKADNSNISQSGDVIYDKIVGNVGIKYALEKFAESGELQQEAKQYLKHSNLNYLNACK